MPNQPSPDLFPDPPRRPRQRRSRLSRRQRWGIACILIACVFFIIGGIYSYLDPRNSWNRKTDIPLISPEAGPIKERPAVPGGVEVPHQDVTIFDQMGKRESQAPQVEHLLPPAETPNDKAVEVGGAPHDAPVPPPPPIPLPSPPPAQSAASPPAATAAIPAPPVAPPPTEPVKISPVTVPPVAALPPVEPAKPVNPEAAKPPVKEPPPLKEIAIKLGKPPEKTAPVPKPDAKGKIKIESTPVMPAGQQRVQLAAFPNAQQAEDKMLHIVSSHAELLRQIKLSVAKADLGARGVFYRIQSQPLPVPAAHKLCADLKTAGVGCILVK